MHFAANALVGESMENPSKYFRNNIAQRTEPARRHDRERMCAGSFSLRPARLSARRSACRSTRHCRNGRSIRTANRSSLRENSALVRRDSRTAIRRAALFQCRRRFGKIRRRSSHRNASDPERAQSRARPESRTSKFTAPITRRRMAPASAITSTFSIYRARTFSRSKRRRVEFYNLGTGGGSSVREVIDACRESHRQRNSRGGKAASSRRSAALDRGLGENQKRARLAAEVPGSRRDHRERLEVAPEISARLRRLT